MTKPCGRAVFNQGACTYPRAKGKQRCLWHWLLAQPADIQQRAATRRRTLALSEEGASPRRIHPKPWPRGQRWCSGCQSFVPLFYTTGSRCKACASNAAHGQRIRREYGISPEDYDALFRFQKGRCYICRRKPKTKRLAVDHDHRTGQVRGLLCANNENGCNRGVVANLEAAADGGLAAARRAVRYLEHPPFARMKGLPPSPDRFAFPKDSVSPEEPPF